MRTVRALFKDGHLLPLEPLGFPDGEEITISVPDAAPANRSSSAELEASFGRYARLVGLFPADVMDQMERDIDEAFEREDANG